MNLKQPLFITLGLLFLSLLTQCATVKPKEEHTEQNFFKWLKNYKQKAQQTYNVDQHTLDTIFAHTKYNYVVHKRDHSQSEFVATLHHYYGLVLAKQTYERGRVFIAQNFTLLQKVEQQYQIPAYLIVALIGIESRYNPKSPSFNAAEALANLAYSVRRRNFFTNELNALIELMNKRYIPLNTTSSWAGALGYPQFMPTTYLAYGVDGDNDGVVDLSHSIPDVLFSVANFLRELGWDYYRDWGYEVTVPEDFNPALINSKDPSAIKPIFVWQSLQVKRADHQPFTDIAAGARLIQVRYNLNEVRTFLVTANFTVLTHWNKSNIFALAVGKLVNYLKEYQQELTQNPALLEAAQKEATLRSTPRQSFNLNPVALALKHLTPLLSLPSKKALTSAQGTTLELDHVKPLATPVPQELIPPRNAALLPQKQPTLSTLKAAKKDETNQPVSSKPANELQGQELHREKTPQAIQSDLKKGHNLKSKTRRHHTLKEAGRAHRTTLGSPLGTNRKLQASVKVRPHHLSTHKASNAPKDARGRPPMSQPKTQSPHKYSPRQSATADHLISSKATEIIKNLRPAHNSTHKVKPHHRVGGAPKPASA